MEGMEALFWSVAFPGFGQLLNRRYVKGILFVALEFLVNTKAHFNYIIMLSFQGKIDNAIQNTNYSWLAFYPCLYFFAMWDAFKDAGGGKDKCSYLPFVFSAYFVTTGIFYSSTFRPFGILFGPVWLPMLFVIPGLVTGCLLKKIMNRIHIQS